MGSQIAPFLPYLIPALVVVFMLRRGLRERSLRIERMWLFPAILVVVAFAAISEEPPPGPALIAAMIAATGLGGLVGWWRGKLTQISVDPATHALTAKASLAGALLIVAVFAVRYALRYALADPTSALGSALHINHAARISDALMLFAVGAMLAQRVEMFIRARKLLTAARAAKPAEA